MILIGFAMGDQEFKLSVDETQYRSRAQKVVIAVKNIKKGTKIVESDIALKELKTSGVAYYTFKSDVVGSIADQDYEINQALLLKLQLRRLVATLACRNNGKRLY